ncbi:MAG: catechol 1,2-dioxygenase, partial [Candidatus Nanopelagicales bacterium]
MGEVVGAGMLAHVPTIMLPEHVRKDLNEGKEISLVPGLHKLRRDKFETLDYDTVIVMDSHWATTVEFVVTAQDRRAGLFTSEELPRGMTRIPYDFLGDPELADAIGEAGAGVGTWMTPIDDPFLPTFYATINLWDFLGRGMDDKRWISISVCQTGDSEDFLRAGRAVKAALEKVDRKVLIIASGAMSHTFWPLREIRDHEASDPKHIFTPAAYAADMVRLDWMKQGDHRSI